MPATGEVSYTYSATLSQRWSMRTAAVENSDLLSGVTFQVTDKDTDPQTRARSASRWSTTFRGE